MDINFKGVCMVRYKWLVLILLLNGCSVFNEPIHGAKPTLGKPIYTPHGWKNGVDGYCDRHKDQQC